MLDITQILLQSNFTTILLCFFLLIFIHIDRSFNKMVNTSFVLATVAVLILVVCDSLNMFFAELEYNPIRDLTGALGYILRPYTLFCIITIVLRKIKKSNSINLIYAVPLMLNTVTAFVSMWTGWVFDYSHVTNEFIRGPIWWTPFVISGFYLILLMVSSVRAYMANGITELITVFCIGFVTYLGTALESMLNYRFLLNGAIATSLVFYYLFLHSQVYKRDTLTSLLNRRSFYMDAKDHLSKEMIIVSIDLNDLKKFNDQGGHSEGDRALVTVANAMRTSFGTKIKVYRTGGDEFMCIALNKDPQEVERRLNNMISKLENTPYTLAYGMSTYVPGYSFEETCKEADRLMYENKVLIKGGLAPR